MIQEASSPHAETSRRSRCGRTCLTVVVLLLFIAACGGAGGGGPDEAPAARNSKDTGSGLDLHAVCPSTIVVQTSWLPDAVLTGALYYLLGPKPKIDTQQKRVTAPLVSRGKDTGVKLELRAGGPAIGYTQTSAQMYLDTNIMLGLPHVDEQIQLSARQPTVAVLALVEKDPQMLFWDPDQHPGIKTISDIGRTDTKVLYFDGDTYMDYLIDSGLLKRSQVDGSYDGSPSRFVASRGEIAQSGYATVDPYALEKEVPDWGKPVRFQLVYNTGYPNYGEILAIRAGDKVKLTPCLRRLVPIVQQAQIDVMAHPEQTIDLTVRLNEAYRSGIPYTRGSAAFAMRQAKALGLVGNGSDDTIGNLDEARLQRMIDITAPIWAEHKKPVKSGLRPSDVMTNQFIDPRLGLPSSQ